MVKKILGSAALASLTLVGAASAQIGTSTATTTPGVPDTGAGDTLVNSMILGVAALIAVGGALYLYMNRRVSDMQ
jgi:LPXTG-motif cell wall-anchored protein